MDTNPRGGETVTVDRARLRGPEGVPPEPFFSIGARLTLEAILRTGDAWEAGEPGNPVLKTLARMPRLLGYSLGH